LISSGNFLVLGFDRAELAEDGVELVESERRAPPAGATAADWISEMAHYFIGQIRTPVCGLRSMRISRFDPARPLICGTLGKDLLDA
jgi:hypothetical protein